MNNDGSNPVYAEECPGIMATAYSRDTIRKFGKVVSRAAHDYLVQVQKISIPPPPLRGTAILRGGGFISEGVGVASRGNVSDANRCIVEQAISYFTVNRCFKARIIVFIVQ